MSAKNISSTLVIQRIQKASKRVKIYSRKRKIYVNIWSLGSKINFAVFDTLKL